VRIIVDEAALEQVFFPCFFGFPLLIIIPPLLHSHLSEPDVCHSTDQAAHYHVLSRYIGDFISDSAVNDRYL
jgi:hypothetical protein